MDLMVRIQIYRGGGGHRWELSKTFPFIRRRETDQLLLQVWNQLPSDLHYSFHHGGIVSGNLRLVGFDFIPTILDVPFIDLDFDPDPDPESLRRLP